MRKRFAALIAVALAFPSSFLPSARGQDEPSAFSQAQQEAGDSAESAPSVETPKPTLVGEDPGELNARAKVLFEDATACLKEQEKSKCALSETTTKILSEIAGFDKPGDPGMKAALQKLFYGLPGNSSLEFTDKKGEPMDWNAALAVLSLVLENGKTRAELEKICGNLEPNLPNGLQCSKRGGAVEDQLGGFLVSAAHDASVIYWSDIKAVKKSIAKSKSGEGAVSPAAAVSDAAADASRFFGVKDLYEDGAVVGHVVVEEGNMWRTVSIKIYTSRDPDAYKPGKGYALKQQIGIFDITEAGKPGSFSNVWGRRFDFTNSEESFDLMPGGHRYHLSIQNGRVSLSKEGGAPAVETSIDELMAKRQAQAKDRGYIEGIAGRKYKVIGQGGARGTLLFFPVDGAGNVLDNLPEHIAEVNELVNGYAKNLDPGPSNTGLGFFTDKHGKKSFYYLDWKPMQNGQGRILVPTLCDESRLGKDETCDFAPPPKPKDVKGVKGSGGGSASQIEGEEIADCSKEAGAERWGNDGYVIKDKSVDISVLCVKGKEMTVPGVIGEVTLNRTNLKVKAAVPIPQVEATNYKKLYGSVKVDWKYGTVCGTPVPNLPTCLATVPGSSAANTPFGSQAKSSDIMVDEEDEYDVNINKIVLENGRWPNIASIAHVIITRKLNALDGDKIEHKMGTIKSRTVDNAIGAWDIFKSENEDAGSWLLAGKNPKLIREFLDRLGDRPDNATENITINLLIGQGSGDGDLIVTGYSSEQKLTKGDLDKGTLPPLPQQTQMKQSPEKKSEKSEKKGEKKGDKQP